VLAKVRVLDCSDESGTFAGKALADLGADVVKVEPPGGDLRARRPPYLAGVADPERSLAWLAANTGKRGITLDWMRPEAGAVVARLLDWADVLLDTAPPGALDAIGLGWDALHAAHPRLVRCTITPFGATGPYAGARARDLAVVAMGGNAAMTGDPDRPPLRCTMPTAYLHAAPEAALGIVMALTARRQHGRGQLVDVSLQEVQCATLLGGPAMHAHAEKPPRRSGARLLGTREIWPARDGHVSFGLRGGPARLPGLRALLAWMQEAGAASAWLAGQAWERFSPTAVPADDLARIEAEIGAFFAARTMRELFDGALARRILLAPCNDAHAVLEQPQLRDRGLFTTIGYPEFGAAIEHPAFFAKTHDAAVRVRGRAPRVGEHNASVYAEAGFSVEEIDKLAAEGLV
jgi:benzylsuccinate CoA-transferase BbsE subunit